MENAKVEIARSRTCGMNLGKVRAYVHQSNDIRRSSGAGTMSQVAMDGIHSCKVKMDQIVNATREAPRHNNLDVKLQSRKD